MRYIIDHDMHIHSGLSFCSSNPEQNPRSLLAYAEKNNYKTLCLTDHMWDSAVPGASDWLAAQNYEHVSKSLPLPESDTVNFLFGCEVDVDKHLTLGISPAVMDKMDFFIISTTHMHMAGFTVEGNEDAAERAVLWCKRLDAVLNMDLPFHKIGIGHLTCPHMYRENYVAVLNAIPTEEYHRLFAKAAKLGVGIELNFDSLTLTDKTREPTLLPYRIAKEEGCKFYFGSDAHNPGDLTDVVRNFENIVDLLNLTEDDKFPLAR
ncbi:MAG: hypothetical protein IJ325_02570 [Clostridia bacterium]|nr:hypothetical protein [Clostridia bacterium]